MSRNSRGSAAGLLVGAIVIALCIWALTTIFNGIDELKQEADSQKELYVGKKLVVETDTFTIVNYSPILETCTLSNGVKVDKKFADKQLFPTKTVE